LLIYELSYIINTQFSKSKIYGTVFELPLIVSFYMRFIG